MIQNHKKDKIENISFQLGTSFEEFKKKFYSRFPDLKIFDFENINLTKVILDGLKVNYVNKGIYNDVVFKPFFIIIIKFVYWKIKYHLFHKKRISSFSTNKKILILDRGRLSQTHDGHYVSYYTENITKHLKKEEYYIICLNDDNKANSILQSVSYSDLYKWAYSIFPSVKDFQFILKLRKFYKNLEKKNLLSDIDLTNIKMGINSFFFQYYCYMKIFNRCKFQKALFTMHYHNEGFLLACKKNNIHTIELQHGLISTKDIFYVFPEKFKEIRERALMPNEIWCYGEYWRNILLSGYEWDKSQIKVFGDYIYRDISAPSTSINSNYILITTQTFLHSYFTEYVKNLHQYLQQNKYDIKIIVKIHPNEKADRYSELKKLQLVSIVTSHLDYWLKHCEYHITIYSTCVFDALIYNKPSYCLYYEEFKDYLEEFNQLPFVKLISPDDFSFLSPNNTIELNTSMKKYYYDDIQYNLLKLL